MGTSLPRSPSATDRMVPSPPAASTTDAPCSTASRACPVPGSCTLVSYHRVSPYLATAAAAVTTDLSRASSTFTGL